MYLTPSYHSTCSDVNDDPPPFPRAARKTFTFAERYAVYRRAKCRCEYCGVKLQPHYPYGQSLAFDHKKPLADGGADTAENLAAVCVPCNQKKKTKSVFAYLCQLNGFEIPDVVRLNGDLIHLADDDEFFLDAPRNVGTAYTDHSLEYDGADLMEIMDDDDFDDPYAFNGEGDLS